MRMITIFLWVLAVTIAANMASAYLTKDPRESSSVLVARQLIPAGTTGQQIAKRQMFIRASVDRMEEGAVSDLKCLDTATQDIYPGEQLTIWKFSPKC